MKTPRKPPYIHDYVDRHGKPRLYFNREGYPRVPLPRPMFSEEFWTAYHHAVKASDEAKASPATAVASAGAGASRTVPGSINALIADYYRSAAFTSKAAATQRNYKSVIEPFRLAHGDKRVATIKTVHIDAILGDIAKRSTAQAKNTRKRLSTLLKLAVKWGYRPDNPMLNVDPVQHKSKGYRTWTEADITKFRAKWEEGTPQRVAFEILLYTGLRRSDAVRLGRQHIQGDFIVIHTKKSGEIVELNIPIHAEFSRLLAGIGHEHLNLIATRTGVARSEKAFTNWIIEAAKDAGLPPHSSPHGLRKAACRRLAEAGCSTLEIMSITGHRNMKEIETYVQAVNQKRLARAAITKRAKAN
jgi:integrase